MYERLDNCPICDEAQYKIIHICEDHLVSEESFAIVKCEECGFVYTNPRPTVSEIGKYYQSEEYVSHSDTRKGLINWIYGKVRNRTLKDKLQLINSFNTEGKRILDIGCGTGHFLSTAQQNGWTVTGVEVDDATRATAESRLNTSIYHHFDEVPEKGKYDIITMWHVLEHVHDLNATIVKLKKLIHKKGRIIIAVPNYNSEDRKIYGDNWAAFDVPRHLYHFTQNSMNTLIRKHGMRIKRSLPMKYDAYYVSLLSEAQLKEQKGKLGQYMTAFKNGYFSNKKAKLTKEYSSLIYIIKL